MVHEHSGSLGYLDMEGASTFDLLPCDFYGTCFECLNEMSFRNVQRATVYQCFGRSSMYLSFSYLDTCLMDVYSEPQSIVQVVTQK
jgi:hypothetical protein